jgi:cell division protein FtsQ
MDRSFAARLPIGRTGSSPKGRRPAGARRAFMPAELVRTGLARVLELFSARRRLRLALICLVVAVPLLGGGWMWLRHSSFVSVEQVKVSGALGAQGGAIESALVEAAHGMSTLAPNVGALKAAVARYPQVSAVRVSTSFPHGMRITVIEQPPAAMLVAGGLRTAVAADGTILGPSLVSSSLPTVGDDVLPAVGARLSNPLLLEAVAVLGAAPQQLSGLIQRAYVGPRGLSIAMKNGLVVLFGDAGRPHAKWISLISVLSDPSSAGASYIDVRLPGRPAAGFSSAASSETHTGTGTTGKTSSESTVAALAAGLKAATPQPTTSSTESETSGAGETSGGEESGAGSTSEESSEGASATPGG